MAAFHLELARGSRKSIPVSTPYIEGHHKLCATKPTKSLGIEGYTELNRSQFLRPSCELRESLSYLTDTQVQVLKDICLVANFSQEFFLSVSKDQWLRTAIICDNPNALFFSDQVKIKDLNPLSPDAVSITIHSKVVPYWPELQVARHDSAPEDARKRPVCFPSMFPGVAVSENKSVAKQLDELEEQWHQRDGDEEGDQHRGGTPFWNIESGDVVIVKSDLGKGGQAVVGKILWRGGIFARKVFKQKEEFDTELEVVRQVFHPHIVYSFGLSISTNEKKQEHGRWYNRPFFSKKEKQHDEKQEAQHSLLMELLDGDLFLLIRDRVRLEGRSKPPFPHRDSVHMLLQVAKAMAHMHGLAEPVIHGDLKSQNILVSHCEILGDVCQYFVKVADFGSAKILNSSSTFRPNQGTTKYSAPEVLMARSEENPEINCPQKIDVYSFGIIAFEVLTGLEPYKNSPSVLVAKEGVTGLVPYEGVSSPSEFKKGVIAGILRPPLQEACSRSNFWSDQPDLVALVESCWHPEPPARPHFSEVAERLESIYNGLNQVRCVASLCP